MALIEYDDTEPPIIDVLVESLPWNEIDSHIRVSKRYLLFPVQDNEQWRGGYWAENRVATTDDLGMDREEAVKQFREFLRRSADASV